MKIYELKLKLFLTNNILMTDIQTEVSRLIDGSFYIENDKNFIHEENKYKYYVFSNFTPIEKDKIYKKNNIYDVIIRTPSSSLKDYFLKYLVDMKSNNIKALTIEYYILPKPNIKKLYNLTPVIIKKDIGYWGNSLSIHEFEKRLKENLIKKYNRFFDVKINEDVEFYSVLEFKNEKPIGVNYKNIKILGDKIQLMINEHKTAQNLAYFSLGCGILEMNARGFGFMQYVY